MPPPDRSLARVSTAVRDQLETSNQVERELTSSELGVWQPSRDRPVSLASYLDRRGPVPPTPGPPDLDASTVLNTWQEALPSALSDGVGGVVRPVDAARVALLDLVNRVLRAQSELAPLAETEAARTLALVVQDRFGGKTLEVRIPPVTAVQLRAWGSGPQHTRGTPPNVIEMNAATWVQLGMGLKQWPQVRATVSASGAHVDEIEAMLPIYPALPTHNSRK